MIKYDDEKIQGYIEVPHAAFILILFQLIYLRVCF